MVHAVQVKERGLTRNLAVEEIRGAGELRALGAEWRALFAASEAAPFLSWEWINAWQEAFGQGQTPHVLCARADGRLLGLAPFSVRVGRPAGMRRLSFLGGGHGCGDVENGAPSYQGVGC